MCFALTFALVLSETPCPLVEHCGQSLGASELPWSPSNTTAGLSCRPCSIMLGWGARQDCPELERKSRTLACRLSTTLSPENVTAGLHMGLQLGECRTDNATRNRPDATFL
jgi:hypothetical protein